MARRQAHVRRPTHAGRGSHAERRSNAGPRTAARAAAAGAGQAAAGLLLDRLVGEPPAWAHPLPVFGRAMAAAERRWWADSRAAGVGHAALGLALGAVAGTAVRSTAAATWLAVGGRALWEAAGAVADALDQGDLEQARALLPALVGRDPSDLDEKEIARAAVESVAENTVDAIVAPALWAAAAGAPGVLAYRALNTLDAMVGHRSARYEQFGWASARLDDAANWPAARATAVLVAAVRPRPRTAAAVARAVRRQAPAHPSPNAGVAEAAFAAALGIRLGGVNRYGDRVEERPPLGDGPPPAAADVRRAIRLSSDVAWALTAAAAAAAIAGEVSGRRRRGSGRG